MQLSCRNKKNLYSLVLEIVLPLQIFFLLRQIDNAASVHQWHDKWTCGHRYRQRHEDERRHKITANRSRHKQYHNIDGTRYEIATSSHGPSRWTQHHIRIIDLQISENGFPTLLRSTVGSINRFSQISRYHYFAVYYLPSISIPVFQSSPLVSSPLSIRTWYGENNDTFNIELGEGTTVDGNTTLQVNLKFISQLSNTLQGFYRVLYEDSDSDKPK